MSKGGVQEHDAEEVLEQLSALVGELNNTGHECARRWTGQSILNCTAKVACIDTFESLPMKSELSRIAGELYKCDLPK